MCSWSPTSLKLSIKLISFLKLSKRGLSVCSTFYIFAIYFDMLIYDYESDDIKSIDL